MAAAAVGHLKGWGSIAAENLAAVVAQEMRLSKPGAFLHHPVTQLHTGRLQQAPHSCHRQSMPQPLCVSGSPVK